MPAELDGRGLGQQVLVKRLAAGRAGDRAIGADEPQVEAERFRDRQSELVPSSGPQHDLDAGFVGPAQGIQVGRGNLDFGVQQRAINIDGDEANGALHHSILTVHRSAPSRWLLAGCERAGFLPANVHKVPIAGTRVEV